jgi:DNA-binding transcriptional MerR regulator
MMPKLYTAADVCELVQLQPYVLRSWEKEFPGIGVQKSVDSQRLYRQSDIDHVLRIKQMVFGEGLTLAGARRRLEAQLTTPGAAAAAADDADEVLETLGHDARARIAMVREGLRSLLDTLSHQPGAVGMPPDLVKRRADGNDRQSRPPAADDYELRPTLAHPRAAKPAPVKARATAARGKTARVASKPAHHPKAKPNPRRKRANA